MEQLSNWHKTKVGYLVFAVVELALAYGAASLSINNGSLWWYFITIVLAIGGLRNLSKLIGAFFTHEHKTASAR